VTPSERSESTLSAQGVSTGAEIVRGGVASKSSALTTRNVTALLFRSAAADAVAVEWSCAESWRPSGLGVGL
jgi:hypothetical protein